MNNHYPVPQAGDILWAWVPEQEGAARGEKCRPALVIDVTESHGLVYVTVAKGTSQHMDCHYLGELMLKQKSDWHAAGLKKPTKFQFKRTEKLPLIERWFDFNAKPSKLPQYLYRQCMMATREAGII